MRNLGGIARVASLLIIFAMVLSACGSSSGGTTGGGTTPAPTAMKVALVTDIGGLNDNGFNPWPTQDTRKPKSSTASKNRSFRRKRKTTM